MSELLSVNNLEAVTACVTTSDETMLSKYKFSNESWVTGMKFNAFNFISLLSLLFMIWFSVLILLKSSFGFLFSTSKDKDLLTC